MAFSAFEVAEFHEAVANVGVRQWTEDVVAETSLLEGFDGRIEFGSVTVHDAQLEGRTGSSWGSAVILHDFFEASIEAVSKHGEVGAVLGEVVLGHERSFFSLHVLGSTTKLGVTNDHENERCSATEAKGQLLSVLGLQTVQTCCTTRHVDNDVFLIRFLRHEIWVTEAKNKKFAPCVSNIFIWFFKNHSGADVRLGPPGKLLPRDNGSGKTNVLDAVHYLCFSKSYFNPIDAQNIAHGEPFMLVQGEFERLGAKEQVSCGVQRVQKKHFANGQRRTLQTVGGTHWSIPGRRCWPRKGNHGGLQRNPSRCPCGLRIGHHAP